MKEDRSYLTRFLIWLGDKTELSFLPMCKVFNNKKTESYTLRYDMLVVIQSTKKECKSKDVIPAIFASQTLIDKMSGLIEQRRKK